MRSIAVRALLAAVALLIAIGLSYELTRYVTRGMAVVDGPTEAEVTLGRDARALSNELVYWANDYFGRFPADDSRPDPGAAREASRMFGNQLRRMLDRAAEDDHPHPVWRDLVAAVYRCDYLIRHPGDARARVSGAAEIRAAVLRCEEWIEVKGIERRLDTARVPLQF